MNPSRLKESIVLGTCLFLGLGALGFQLGSSLIEFKEYERTVTAKGLSEREMPADIALWPIQFTSASNELGELYVGIERDTQQVLEFLESFGFGEDEITVSAPAVVDKLAQQYGNTGGIEFRYTATRSVTVYSSKVNEVRDTINRLVDLGKAGITITGDSYQSKTEYIFTGLNDVKPEMIEEATRKAREVAEEFAADSESKLGKIKNARQGQFSIVDRDKNTPHIKRVRVVTTVEYYLSD